MLGQGRSVVKKDLDLGQRPGRRRLHLDAVLQHVCLEGHETAQIGLGGAPDHAEEARGEFGRTGR